MKFLCCFCCGRSKPPNSFPGLSPFLKLEKGKSLGNETNFFNGEQVTWQSISRFVVRAQEAWISVPGECDQQCIVYEFTVKIYTYCLGTLSRGARVDINIHLCRDHIPPNEDTCTCARSYHHICHVDNLYKIYYMLYFILPRTDFWHVTFVASCRNSM